MPAAGAGGGTPGASRSQVAWVQRSRCGPSRAAPPHLGPAPSSPPSPPPQGLIFVEVDSQHVVVSAKSGKVQCVDAGLRGRVERALERMHTALAPVDVSDVS